MGYSKLSYDDIIGHPEVWRDEKELVSPAWAEEISELGYKGVWAKEDGFPEMAEEMEKRVGISKGIEKIIEPQAPKRSRGYEMEL